MLSNKNRISLRVSTYDDCDKAHHCGDCKDADKLSQRVGLIYVSDIYRDSGISVC